MGKVAVFLKGYAYLLIKSGKLLCSDKKASFLLYFIFFLTIIARELSLIIIYVLNT